MTRIVLDPRKLPKGKTDWKALRVKPDSAVVKAARSDPDAKPLAPQQIERLLPVVDVTALRKKLGMTQVVFCKTFKLSLGTVRDWEQHRFIPEGPARVLLTVIERDPETVIQALCEYGGRKPSKSRDKAVGKKPHKSGRGENRRNPVAA